jgi:ABC-2 type transport system ATP-binding protein
MMDNIALKLQDLKKIYDNKFEALKDINLSIKQGDFFALLGVNGAGKTTTINIISGLLPKTAGKVIAFGNDQDDDNTKLKRLIGLMPQEFNFNPFEPIEEILTNQAGYYGIKRSEALERAEELLKKMELWDKRKQMAKTLSGGMKRRLMLARALMHQPKILILDEPSAGVDVEIRLSIWQFLRELNAEGITIILTTHYLEEAEKLCKNIAIIDGGEVITHTSMAELLKQAESRTITLELENQVDDTIKLTDNYRILANNLIEVTLNKEQDISQIILELSKYDIVVKDISHNNNRLENLFLNLTQKQKIQ